MKLSDITFRARALFARRGLESQVDEEFAFHLRMETEKLMAQGMNESDANAEARRRFGNVTREHERARDAWGVRLGYDLMGDVRHAFRQLRRRPGFSVIAILTLGLGIGATAALFTVVNGMLLRPLPFANEERLQMFWMEYSWRGVEYDHIREGSTAFDEIVAYSSLAEAMRLGDETKILPYIPATANLFDALGTKPMLGRGFEPGEDRVGAEPVLVISHGLWRQELGSDPNVIGRKLELGGVTRTIVGVMPPGFYFPSPDNRAWRPLILDPSEPIYQNTGWLSLLGVERPGTTPVQVKAELDRITKRLGERFTYPAAWDKTKDASVTPIREGLVGNVRGRHVAGDRLRQCGGADPGAHHGPDGRTDGPVSVRRRPLPDCSTDRHRVPCPRAGGSDCRSRNCRRGIQGAGCEPAPPAGIRHHALDGVAGIRNGFWSGAGGWNRCFGGANQTVVEGAAGRTQS
jgi:hypothetical protein